MTWELAKEERDFRSNSHSQFPSFGLFVSLVEASPNILSLRHQS